MAEPFELGWKHAQEDEVDEVRVIAFRPLDDYDLDELEEYMQGYREGRLG